MLTSFLCFAAETDFVLAAARKPGVIVGPIASILGAVYNALFNFIYAFIQSGSLGIAIILFTVLVKVVLFPLSYHQQKSSYKMQKLQPEMNKIRNKYAGKSDQQSQQKMAFELQKFQKENGISLFGGCLPLLVQLPILYALFYIFQQAYLYVDVINVNYTDIANAIINIPVNLRMDAFMPYAQQVADATKLNVDLSNQEHVIQIINTLSIQDWDTIIVKLKDSASSILPLLAQKNQMEYFLGIHLVDKPGLMPPGLIIPLASAFTTWLSSKLMLKDQPSSQPGDPTASMMKSMNIFMPIMMGVMCISMPAGLGLYWTISNVFQMLQQMVLKKFFRMKEKEEAEGVV